MIGKPVCDRLLDAGGGTGALTTLLRREMAVKEVVIIDDSDVMLDQAESSGRRICCPLEAIPAGLGEFDVILVRQVLHYLEEPAQVLRQLASLLTDDGVIYVGQIVSPTLRSADWFKRTFKWTGTSRRHAWSVTSLLDELTAWGFMVRVFRTRAFESSLDQFLRRSPLGAEGSIEPILESIPTPVRKDLQIRSDNGQRLMTMNWLHAVVVPAEDP